MSIYGKALNYFLAGFSRKAVADALIERHGIKRSTAYYNVKRALAEFKAGVPWPPADVESAELKVKAWSNGKPKPEPETLPPPPPEPEAKPEAPVKSNPAPKTEPIRNDVEALAKILQGIAAAGLNESKVREIVKDEVKRSAGITRLEVAQGPEVRKVKGTVAYWVPDVIKVLPILGQAFIKGPAGTGKTLAARQIAEALGFDEDHFGFLSITEGVSESEITGWLIPIPGSEGKAVYLPTKFVFVYENGGVFLFDEIDGGDPNVLLAINAALANGHLAIPRRTDKPVAVRHDRAYILTAANTWGHGATGQYVGRNRLDGATLDRFVGAEFGVDYDRKLEAAIGDTDVCTFVWAVRDAVRKHKLEKIVSTRAVVHLSKLKAGGLDFKARFWASWDERERALVAKEVTA